MGTRRWKVERPKGINPDGEDDAVDSQQRHRLESGVHALLTRRRRKEKDLHSGIKSSHIRYSNILDIIAENDITVPDKHLKSVISEILPAYPDESICFLNIGDLRMRAQLLQEHFIPTDPRRTIAYAIKANPRAVVLQTLMEEGLTYFDCASPSEVAHIKHHTIEGENATILYNNPVKLGEDIAVATRMGVRHFTAQSCDHVETIFNKFGEAALGKDVEIAARLKADNEHADINLSSTKFGASPNEVVRMIHMVRNMVSTAPGISIHTGSQNRSIESFERAIKLMADVAERAGGVDTINVGGGIPVNYFEDDHYCIVEYLKHISHAVREHVDRALSRKSQHDQMIAMELGRATVADAADLFIPIMDVKQGQSPAIHFNDGVFTSFIDFPLHRWRYNLKAVKPDGSLRKGKLKPFMVFGRSCDSGDHLGTVDLSEDMQKGDYIWVANAGAYLDSVSTMFNGFLPPRYVTYNQSMV